MNILLVDDDFGTRFVLSTFLKRLGHNITEAEDGEKALIELKDKKFNVVLSDIKMPNMGGLELLKNMKANPDFKDILVVFITGFGNVKGAVDALRQGAYDYLLKPVDVNELAISIERISEYLVLKREHKRLSENFKQELSIATQKIEEELSQMKKAYAKQVGIAQIGVYSKAMEEVFEKALKLHYNKDIPVLIEGETGTGKEVLTRYIHFGQGSVTTPFIAVNCAAISPTLFESELFGYDAGAFTGSNTKGQKGKLELAEDGTLFLDEIGKLSPEYQAKLLRVIEQRNYYRVGGIKNLRTDARIICATNQDVRKKVEKGDFRKDLYFRLEVGHLKIPPLRERREEIIPLSKLFLDQLKEHKKTRIHAISSEASNILLEHDWPGNVRELKNTIEKVSFLWDDEVIEPRHLNFLFEDRPRATINNSNEAFAVNDLPERQMDLNKWILSVVQKALDKYNGNKTDAANYLGISRSVLYTYLKHLKDNPV